MRILTQFVLIAIALAAASCNPNRRIVHGPDKQFAGSLQGAATGAGTGAVTGFQLGSGTGPGAAVGAGLGAVVGGIQGMVSDQTEENLLALAAASQTERERLYAQEVLSEQFKRRMELHPTREIYPADLFFYGDESVLRPEGRAIVRELAQLNKERAPWSRLVVASYVKASDKESKYAKHLAGIRSRQVCVELVKAGIEPRRLEARAAILEAPLVIDPLDKSNRYNQAIELIAVDK
ncbi:MAG: hypothetical protein DCC75_06330 [Proteobacteria bacterium]|nr:MAG: hypothetical protein DCC75_06330 [Pseudomonadota bacterium]